jgi:hypothetical protein
MSSSSRKRGKRNKSFFHSLFRLALPSPPSLSSPLILSHTLTHSSPPLPLPLSLCLSDFLYPCLSISVFLCLSVSVFCVAVSLCLSLSNSLTLCLNISLSLCLSVCLCAYLSAYRSVSLLISLPICLSLCLSLCLSDCLYDCLSAYLSVSSLCVSLSFCLLSLFVILGKNRKLRKCEYVLKKC